MADPAQEGTILALLRDRFPTILCTRFEPAETPSIASLFRDYRARYRVYSAEDRSSSDGGSLFDAFDLGDFSFLLHPALTCFQVAWYSDGALLLGRPEFLVQRLPEGWLVCLFLHSQDFDADSFHLDDLTRELQRVAALLGVRGFLFGYEGLCSDPVPDRSLVLFGSDAPAST